MHRGHPSRPVPSGEAARPPPEAVLELLLKVESRLDVHSQASSAEDEVSQALAHAQEVRSWPQECSEPALWEEHFLQVAP